MKTEKLTIEHLAPYLPYVLKIHDGSYTRELVISHSSYDTNSVGLSRLLNPNYDYALGLPCLHPLSDLTKEIEHKGGRFVPMEELFKIAYPASDIRNIYNDVQINYIRCSHEGTSYHVLVHTNQENFGRNYNWIVNKLHQWHFDTKGLIESNLAIDKNTLNK